VTGGDWSEWLYRGLVFMVISCPCALVVSIPLGFLGGIAKSSRMGMIVKGSNYLEALNQVSIAAFDKTGTLTEGVFTVTRIMPADDQVTESELLKIAAYAEADISHPIAKSILKAYGGEIDHTLIESLTEIPGQGIQAQIDGKQVWVGNQKLMDARQISLPKLDENGTLVHIAEEQRYLGSILIADTIKKDSAEAIRRLKQLGIQKTVLLTGDRTEVGDAVGNTLGIDQVFSSLLPDQKVAAIETLLAEKPAGSSLIFVGDGVNDAPVLARADIGIAMGKLGSDAAIEAADVVILTDEPSRLPDLIEIARRTRQIVWQNIIFTLVVKGVILLLGAMGIAGMWIAVFADVGVMLLAVLNSLRVLR
jgi:Cd2+/Zn2+-exporting ATPase